MSKEKISRRIRPLLTLACLLGIMALAVDGGRFQAKAQNDPICASLATTTTLLSGNLEYCGSTTQPQLSLTYDANFTSLLSAQLMVFSAESLLERTLVTDITQGEDGVHLHLGLNE